MSEFSDELGRICAKSCDGVNCGVNEVCVTQPETEPACMTQGESLFYFLTLYT